jgi:hypothetical protein
VDKQRGNNRAPTYETGLFPLMAHLLDLAVRKGIKKKKTLYFEAMLVGRRKEEWGKIGFSS